MTDLQVKYHDMMEKRRHNEATEQLTSSEQDIEREKVQVLWEQAKAALIQAEAAARNAKTNEERSKWEKESNQWKNVLGTISTGLSFGSAFGFTPMGASEIFANVGKGMSGVASMMGAI